MPNDFYSFMGMKKVVIGPDGNPLQQIPTGAQVGINLPTTVAGLAFAGLTAALALAPTSANLPEMIRSLEGQRCTAPANSITGVADRVAYCRHFLSLNMKQMADVLKVQRPTVYSWLEEDTTPHPGNDARLNTLYKVANTWARLADRPLGLMLSNPTSVNKTIFQMLCESNINVPQVRNILSQLVSSKNMSEVSPGEERFAKARSLGYEKLSKKEAAQRLRVNVPI